MGHYTYFVFNARLAVLGGTLTPNDLTNGLGQMLFSGDSTGVVHLCQNTLPDHPFFGSDDYGDITEGRKFHFPSDFSVLTYDRVNDQLCINLSVHLRNDDNEIEKFLDWVLPFIVSDDGLLGYHLRDTEKYPTLIFLKDGTYNRMWIKDDGAEW